MQCEYIRVNFPSATLLPQWRPPGGGSHMCPLIPPLTVGDGGVIIFVKVKKAINNHPPPQFGRHIVPSWRPPQG